MLGTIINDSGGILCIVEQTDFTELAVMTVSASLAQRFREEVAGAQSVLIGTHMNPDGDALGSALALSHYFDQEGISHEVLCHHSAPANLKFLPGVDRVRQAPFQKDHDLGIMLDLEALSRLGNVEPFFSRLPRLVVIDHHVPMEAPGDLRIVQTEAPATALILANLLFALNAEVTPDMATCLLTGIVTDTGSFRFRNTTAEAMHVSARLLELGGDINRVSEEVFQRKPLASARLLGYLLERMTLEEDNRIAYGGLTFDDFDKTNAKDEDTEGFVNELLSIDTVQIAALFREGKKGRVRISFRSRDEYNVAEVAQEFGGGGHRNAAGCAMDGHLLEVIAAVVPRIKACLASS